MDSSKIACFVYFNETDTKNETEGGISTAEQEDLGVRTDLPPSCSQSKPGANLKSCPISIDDYCHLGKM